MVMVKKSKRDVFVNIDMSMLMSRAWQTMNSRQKILYLCCKAQSCCVSVSQSEDDIKEDRKCFEFPQRLWLKKNEKLSTPAAPAETYNLYSDKKYFYKDMAILIDHGFVDCVDCGAGFGKKNLYTLSDRWRNYGQPRYTVPDYVKTIAMRETTQK